MSEPGVRLDTVSEFVITIFRGVLGRDPEPQALDHYAKALANGVYDKEQLVDTLLRSEEFRTRFEVMSSARIGKKRAERGDFISYGKEGQRYSPYVADPTVFGKRRSRYMETANCISQDFLDPQFSKFCARIGHPASLHRKLWEYGFVAHHLQDALALRSGAKGVGFGVGAEPLSSLYASMGCQILATDAPRGLGSEGHSLRNQSGRSRGDIFHPTVVDGDTFDRNVLFKSSDMNHIDDSICNFDFCWSVDCLGYLGSIEDGFKFIERSVANVVKVGGISVHTGQLNVSSHDQAIDAAGLSLYSALDIERLIERLERRGHKCARLPIEPGASFVDYLVDVPPFGDVHLKWRTGEFVCTSFGLVVTRGQ